MREAFAVAIAVPFLVGAALAPADADRDVVFRFADPAIVESSGLTAAGGLVTTVNDSGDSARVFTVDAASGRTVGVTTWDGEATDVEALAPAGDGEVWVGDIGDNAAARDEVTVTRVPVGRGDRSVAGESFRLVYPDGPADAEALLAHPRTGRLFVVTKGVFGGEVYAAPSALRADAPNRLRLLGDAPGIVTDGAFFPDGRHLLLRNYGRAFVLSFPSLDLVGGFDLPAQKQGEGIAVGARRHRLRELRGGAVAGAADRRCRTRSPRRWPRRRPRRRPARARAAPTTAPPVRTAPTAPARRRPRRRPPRRQRAPAQRRALARRLPVPRHRPGRPDPRPPPPLTRPSSGIVPDVSAAFPSRISGSKRQGLSRVVEGWWDAGGHGYGEGHGGRGGHHAAGRGGGGERGEPGDAGRRGRRRGDPPGGWSGGAGGLRTPLPRRAGDRRGRLDDRRGDGRDLGDPRRRPELHRRRAGPRAADLLLPNALAVADELGARTVAFPLVSAGIYGWPRQDAIAAAVETLRATPTEVEEARLVAFGRAAYDEIAAAL